MSGTFVKVSVDFKAFEGFFDDLNNRQVPFATSLAVNRLAKDVREAGDASVKQNFVVRKPWITEAFVISSVSDKKQELISATIEVKQNHSLLNKFEEGGTKTSRDPTVPVAIPTSAIRPGFNALAPLALYPKNLGLMPRRGPTGEMLGARGKAMKNGIHMRILGKQRTFVIDPATMPGAAKWGVYQRTGPGKRDIRRIWTFKRSIPIPRRLGFALTAQKTVDENWAQRFTEAWEQALRTAR